MYKFFSCSTDILRGLSAYKLYKLVVYYLNTVIQFFLSHFFFSLICQVVAYRRLRTQDFIISQSHIPLKVVLVTCETWSLTVGSKYMYCDLTMKLFVLENCCNQRLQSLLNLNSITVHNILEKQHCPDVRDKQTCWYGSCLRTVAVRQAESVVQELRWHISRAFKLHNLI